MKVMRRIEGKTRRVRIRYEICREGTGIQTLLIELEEKQLQNTVHI
jgi:hypothetical protein